MTPVEKLDILIKGLLRHWSHELTAIELLVILFVADRTIGWNEDECWISIPELISGDPPYRMRVQASARTVTDALSALVERGYLIRQGKMGDRRGYLFTINLERLEDECEMVDLPTRRRDRPGYVSKSRIGESGHVSKSRIPTSANSTCHLSKSDVGTSANPMGPITVTKNGNTQQEQEPQHDPVGSLEEAEASAGRLTDAAVERKVKKAGSGSSADALFAVWRAGTLEGFDHPSIVPWARGEKARVKKFASLSSDPVTLMAFATKNWKAVMRSKFSWMKTPGPALPDIGFFLRFASKFNEALYDEAHLESGIEMDPAVRLRRLGYTGNAVKSLIGSRR